MFRRVFLSLSWSGLLTFPLVSSHATLTVLKSSPVTHRARAANFGAQMTPGATNYANLMLPPNESDPYLCEEPGLELLDTPSEFPDHEVALFVSRGECSFERKAQNAAKLQKNTTLRYVVVYNNDNENQEGVLVMSAASPEEAIGELYRLSLVFVSTDTGSKVLQQLTEHSDRAEKSPYFLDTNSEGWDMPILLEKLPPPDETGQPTTGYPFGSSNSNSGRGASSGSTMFYWLRFVLFALLIVAPCMRALYLWWGGGGRVLFRRNEEGRIIGLQYIRPMRYWFAGGAAASDNAENTVSDRLTKEEFQALPMIEYRSPSSDREENSTESENVSAESQQANDTDETPKVEGSTASHEDSTQSTEEAYSYTLSGSCTTCSICIDDFEEGERLCLLPRCRHGFHPDCILPWLTERQGCCPLCKTSVLEGVTGSEADTDVEASFETSPSVVDEITSADNDLEDSHSTEMDTNVERPSEQLSGEGDTPIPEVEVLRADNVVEDSPSATTVTNAAV